jgi:hypothetical protein
MHPLTGTWTANLEKSTRHANHQFRRATMRFEVEGDAVSLAYDGVNAAGKTEEGARTFRADGAAHPDAAAPGVIATSRIDDRTLEVVATKDGAPVGRASYSVSEDGRSLTSTTSGTDASGRAFDQVIVFDRA